MDRRNREGRSKQSRFELFIRAPIWLLAVLFVLVTAMVLLTALRDGGVI